jgi:hypothetical protein
MPPWAGQARRRAATQDTQRTLKESQRDAEVHVGANRVLLILIINSNLWS